RDDAKIVDGARAIAIQNQDRLRDRWFRGGIVKTGNTAGGGLHFANKMRGSGAFGGNDDGAGAKSFATGEGKFAFMQRIDMGIEANRISGKFFGKLRGNGAHAARGDGGVAFGEHLENEFKHAAGRLQFAIEENAAEKRAEEAMDYFFGKTRGFEGVLGGAVGTLEKIVDGGAAKAHAERGDAKLVPERTEIG